MVALPTQDPLSPAALRMLLLQCCSKGLWRLLGNIGEYRNIAATILTKSFGYTRDDKEFKLLLLLLLNKQWRKPNRRRTYAVRPRRGHRDLRSGLGQSRGVL